MPDTARTLQQERAAKAWEKVQEIEQGGNKGFQKEYGSLVRGLPAMILQNGLAQSVAFLSAKGGTNLAEVHSVVLRHLTEGVRTRLAIPEAQEMLPWLLNQSTPRYRLAASESLAFLHWLKRFVEAKDWRSEEK